MQSLASELQYSLNPGMLLSDLEMPLFRWQVEALDPRYRRVLIVAARQAGKSTISGGDVHHSARFYPGSVNIIVSPSEQQSKETMKKVDELIHKDPHADLEGNASFEKTYANKARVIALPGTERSVRGYSRPRRLILDEASRIEDPTYKATRPYFVDNPQGKILAVSTPWGRKGWFYEAWANSRNWHKMLVKPGFKLDPSKTEVIPDMPEDMFREIWAAQGVSAHYSPRHKIEFLQEELDEMGWWWWQQEFGCEFLDSGHGMIDMEAIREAREFNTDVMFKSDDHVSNDEILRFV